MYVAGWKVRLRDSAFCYAYYVKIQVKARDCEFQFINGGTELRDVETKYRQILFCYYNLIEII